MAAGDQIGLSDSPAKYSLKNKLARFIRENEVPYVTGRFLSWYINHERLVGEMIAY